MAVRAHDVCAQEALLSIWTQAGRSLATFCELKGVRHFLVGRRPLFSPQDLRLDKTRGMRHAHMA